MNKEGKNINIALLGVNRWNKGAELMLIAASDHLRQLGNDIVLAVDSAFGSFAERTDYSVASLTDNSKITRSTVALSLLHATDRRRIGALLLRDIDACLDASGFAFGDQHPPQRAERFARTVTYLRKKKKPVILLPQALGPFNTDRARVAFATIVGSGAMIFARDEESYNHVASLGKPMDNVFKAPDFTCLVKPVILDHERNDRRVLVVPNQRMIEMARSPKDADDYVNLIVSCIERARDNALEPVMLVHGNNDAELADMINSSLGLSVQILREEDPVQIKALIGASNAVIGSRYHALISALGQGIPCIATSWSHKYEMLFDEYGCPDLVLPVNAGPGSVRTAIEKITGTERANLIEKIQLRSREVESETRAMWSKVDSTLRIAIDER